MVYNIRMTYLLNVICSHGDQPQLLNIKTEQSCVLQVIVGRTNIALDVVKYVE